MFAAVPRWRDRFDGRRAVLVAVFALVAFALQLALFAGTVAHPLGGMIADLERPRVEVSPVRMVQADAVAVQPDGSLTLRLDPSVELERERQYCVLLPSPR